MTKIVALYAAMLAYVCASRALQLPPPSDWIAPFYWIPACLFVVVAVSAFFGARRA